ncbi:hypothetical protein [Fructilactobacillus cliffordii]|uniref:Uncharacterized protein n=1 Tax=Fructilactobacillus cliffordii TaxID=2940299 RepID=A0A9Q9E2N2_9LACO|nr:hypothetical protein [Fructilactobacillus cliffordii]USS89975.1 hypothetical protein M3M40_07245 [Fructilactobacillus cliffordii]
MNSEFLKVIGQLDDFDTKDHQWCSEIGEYDVDKGIFIDVKNSNDFDKDDWDRISEERKLYVKLVNLRTLDFTSAGYDDKESLFKKAMMLENFGLTNKQICRKLKVNDNFLRANRDEYRGYKKMHS